MTTFDVALSTALQTSETLADAGVDVLVVRDLLGRCKLLLSGDLIALAPQIAEAATTLERLGPYTPPDGPISAAAETFGLDSLLEDPTRRIVRPRHGAEGEVSLLERTVVGQDWLRVEPRAADGDPEIIVLYSLKGGVGRSTAGAFLADALAEDGRCVLLVDLDLESPGVGRLLLSSEATSELGVVDVLVEGAVEAHVAPEAVVRRRQTTAGATGELWIAPAAGAGRPGYSYLPKLARIYLDAPGLEVGSPARPFASRLGEAINELVAAVETASRRPSVVLIDCRAGVHDLAAVALTDLADHGLLFATDNDQTWWGYRQLFELWAERPDEARRIRERLRVVAAQVDRADPDSYVAAFRERAADCFEALYDQADPGDERAFNPAVDEVGAPHDPLVVLFDTELRNIHTESFGHALENDVVKASFDRFVEGVRRLLRPEAM